MEYSKRKSIRIGRPSDMARFSILRIKQILLRHNVIAPDKDIQDFYDWMTYQRWIEYQDYIMNQRTIIANLILNAPVTLNNGTQGKPYKSNLIRLPNDSQVPGTYTLTGLEGSGLETVISDNGADEAFSFIISGTPVAAGEFRLIVSYTDSQLMDGQPPVIREIPIIINPDPKTLWKDIPTDENIPYFKPDTCCEYLRVDDKPDGTPQKDIVAASRRGRSHAQEGKARDDHFKLFRCPDSEWYIIAVADGAGSAKFSRKGSEIACDVVVDYCKERLLDNQEFESAILAYHQVASDPEKEPAARKAVGNLLYGIVCQAAFAAHKRISETAQLQPDTRVRDFSTTLLLAICKKFDFGWFYATFWVGDGALCIYNEKDNSFSLLGSPDEGEYSGQTRFITMKEIFSDPGALFNRLRFGIKDDFTALFLMTDGVSDPMFGTDANLNDINKWNEFWHRLKNGFPEDNIPGVDLSDNNEISKDQLLNWLNFWVPGEHDDRTIAILY